MNNKSFNLDYVDSMMVVDKNLKVLYTVRVDPSSRNEGISNVYFEYMDMHYFDVYPQLDPNESTMVKCLKTRKVIYFRNQTFKDFRGYIYHTNNITYPIIRHGEIVGAIELSQDVTSIGDLEGRNNQALFKRSNESNLWDEEDQITFDDIITSDPDMLDTIQRAKLYADLNSPVLIYGETGTGKELFVKAMVNQNAERRKRYIAHNCAATPESLFESILFGSRKGAFTGAEDKQGLFELADGGTLFLDELNSMPVQLQPKLLRVLQDGIIRPIGSTTEKKLNVKVIVAINQDPIQLIKEGKLREDLFYRLSSNTLYLSPLRQRRHDIPLYVDYFIKKNRGSQIADKKVSSSLMDIFSHYSWPGNVRELKHVIESMINISREDKLVPQDLPAYLKDAFTNNGDKSGPQASLGTNESVFKISLNQLLERTEREHIIKALKFTNGNVVKAAEILDLPRQTLKYRMEKLNISYLKSKRK